MTAPQRTCRCGHDETEHEHWRAGTDCGRCGWQRCPGFDPSVGRPPISPELRRLLAVAFGIPLAIFVIAIAASIGGVDAIPAAVLAVIGAVSVYCLICPRADQHDDERGDR